MVITKAEAAMRQLDTAARLFLEGDFVSSLTLAGAAEEILGRLAKRAGEPTALDRIATHHRADTDPSLTDAQHMKLISDIANRARNEAKHLDTGNGDMVDDDQTHALMMLMRAIPMAFRLKLPPIGAHLASLHRWIEEHPESTL